MSAVHLELFGHLAELRLDNPGKLNCLTTAMLGQMAQHLEVLEGAARVRAVLLTAVGDRAFCSGADIGAWGDLGPAAFARDWVQGGHRLFDRLARLGKPTVAVISGHAFGGGLELAAACDVRLMHPKATLALPEAAVGIVPGWSGTQRLSRLIPEGILKDMALFGTRLSAAQALACGFVAEVSEDPRAAALARAERAAGLSPRAVEIAKAMIHAAAGEDRGAMVEMLGSAAIAASADRDEGVAAFRGKRAPVFPGT